MKIQASYFFIFLGLLCTTAHLHTAHNGDKYSDAYYHGPRSRFFNMVNSTALTALGNTPENDDEQTEFELPVVPQNRTRYADRESAYSLRKLARFVVPLTAASTTAVALYQKTSNPLLSSLAGLSLIPLMEELVSRVTRATRASNLSKIADKINDELRHSRQMKLALEGRLTEHYSGIIPPCHATYHGTLRNIYTMDAPSAAVLIPQSEPITMLSESTNSTFEIEYKNSKMDGNRRWIDTNYTITITHDTIISRTIASLKGFKNWLFQKPTPPATVPSKSPSPEKPKPLAPWKTLPSKL